MPADIACCRECSSLNVVFANEYVDGSHRYYYSCCDCGHITPDRPALKDADQDVEWVDSHEMRVR